MSLQLGTLRLPNPVMPASGCFGPELGALIDLNRLGALVTKTVFFRPRGGNPAHRVTEVPSGMLNSVGIPSLGADRFRAEVLPGYARYEPPTIVSIGGLAVDEYWEIADALADHPDIDAFEVNVSCPNLEAGGLEIGADPKQVERVTRGVVDRSSVPVIVKLTPNVTRISEIARAAEAGGASGVTAINTVVGAAVSSAGRSELGMPTGGLSGPAIKPIALRAVFEASNKVSIPVIASGGIATVEDAREFLAAGAAAIQVGTANFTRPDTMISIIYGLSGESRSPARLVGTHG